MVQCQILRFFLAAIDGKTCVMHEAWKKVTVLFLTSVAELRIFLHFALKP
jgi:hypothetical protein